MRELNEVQYIFFIVVEEQLNRYWTRPEVVFLESGEPADSRARRNDAGAYALRFRTSAPMRPPSVFEDDLFDWIQGIQYQGCFEVGVVDSEHLRARRRHGLQRAPNVRAVCLLHSDRCTEKKPAHFG